MKTKFITFFSMLILFSIPVQATVLTFEGKGRDVPIDNGFGDNIAAAETGINISNGPTPNIGLTWGCSLGAQWLFYNSAVTGEWQAGKMFGLVDGNSCSITFTPDSGYGVQVDSFVFDDYDDLLNTGSSFNWELRQDSVTGTVIASGTESTSDGQNLPISTGISNYYLGPLVLNITGLAGNDGSDEALDNISFTQIYGYEWDGTAGDGLFSNSLNWLGDTALADNTGVMINTSSDAIAWDASITALGSVTLDAGFSGTVSTTGNVDRILSGDMRVNNGVFSTEHLVQLNSFFQTASGTLELRLDTNTDREFGNLDMAGSASYAGKLRVVDEGATYTVGDIFDLLDVSGVIFGTFDSVELPRLDISQKWDLSVLYIDGYIIVADSGVTPTSFVTEWTLPAAETITLPLLAGGNYNFTVDYGDGSPPVTVTSATDPNASHTYSAGGTYLVVINGQLEGFSFQETAAHQDRLSDIRQWGSMRLSYPGYTAGNFFANTSNLKITATDVPDMTFTTDMRYAFHNSSITSIDNLSSWDMSGVTNMSSLFEGASSFNGDIGAWNVSAVTNMSGLFFQAAAFNQDLSSWNVQAVTSMSNMFQAAANFNQDIGAWNISNVTTMESMFTGSSDFNQDVSSWNVSGTVSLQNMFLNASSFNQNLGGWNVEGAVNLEGMLSNSGLSIFNFDQLILAWDGQALPPNMTLGANGLNYTTGGPVQTAYNRMVDLVANGGDNWTINAAVGVAPDGAWDGGSTQDLKLSTPENWSNDDGVSTGWRAVISTGSDAIIWDDHIVLGDIETQSGFSGTITVENDVNVSVLNSVTINAGTLVTDATVSVVNYSQGAGSALSLILDSASISEYGRVVASEGLSFGGSLNVSDDGVTFSVGDQFDLFDGTITGSFSSVTLPTLPNGLQWDQSELLTTGVIRIQQPMLLSVDTQYGLTVDLRFHGTLDEVTIDWGDGSALEDVTAAGVYSHTYSSVSQFEVRVMGAFSGFGWQNVQPDISKTVSITGVTQWNQHDGLDTLVDLSGAFISHQNLLTVPSVLPSTVTNLDRLFYNAKNFNQSISSWNMSNVSSMVGMFRGAAQFNQDISAWNVAAVSDMSWMFYEAGSFNQNIGGWTISNVTNMANMFLRANLSQANYDALLNGWNAQSVQTDVPFHGGVSTYTAGSTADSARATLMSSHGWTINDGGPGTEMMRWEPGSNNLSALPAFSTAVLSTDLAQVVIDSSETSIVWDSPTTLHRLSLDRGFTGILRAQADTDMFVTESVWVNAGQLTTDALISTGDYLQGVKGVLTLIIDSRTDGLYGRVQASNLVRFGGELNVVNDGLSLVSGDQFDLFNGTKFMGSFASITLPDLTTGLIWDVDSLYTEGVIRVVNLSRQALLRGASLSSDDSVALLQLPSINRTVAGETAPAPSASDIHGLDSNYQPVTHLNPLAGYEPGQHRLYWRVRHSDGGERVAEIVYNVYPEEARPHHNLGSSSGLSLRAHQGDHETFTIARDAGPVVLRVSMDGADVEEDMNLEWSIPSTLMALSGDFNSRLLDPVGAFPGVYTVKVTAFNMEGDLVTKSLNLRLVEGDHVDMTLVDGDNDYLLDGYDQASEGHRLQLFWGASDHHFLETTQGLRLSLGVEAMAVEAAGAMISQKSLKPLFDASVLVYTDNHTEWYSAPLLGDAQQRFYSVEIHDLEFSGDRVSLTVPLNDALHEDATLLLLVDGTWQEFHWDQQNQLYSVDSGGDHCSSIDVGLYESGIRSGADCLLLMVTDGGMNDRDLVEDGKAALFFTLKTTTPEVDTQFRDVSGMEESLSEEGGGSLGVWIMLLLGGCFIARCRQWQ